MRVISRDIIVRRSMLLFTFCVGQISRIFFYPLIEYAHNISLKDKPTELKLGNPEERYFNLIVRKNNRVQLLKFLFAQRPFQ